MADLLLGPLVELVIREPGRGLQVHPVRGRWLTWDPSTSRLWSVRRGRRMGPAAEPDRERVAGFHWEDVDADLWSTVRPVRPGRTAGTLAAVVYQATKGEESAEWVHWFDDPPAVERTDDGEWLFRGRVVVTDRGIES